MRSVHSAHLSLLQLRLLGDFRIGVFLHRADIALPLNNREGTENVADITPPLLSELLVPVDRTPQASLEWCLLIPAQFTELGPVNGIAMVVEWSIVRVFDPLVKVGLVVTGNVHLLEEPATQFHVGDFIIRAYVVDMTHSALVQDSVKGVGRISSIEISARRAPVPVEDHRISTVQQRGKFGNNFCAHVNDFGRRGKFQGRCLLSGN